MQHRKGFVSGRATARADLIMQSRQQKKRGQASNPLPARSEPERLIHPLLCSSVAQWVTAALSHEAEQSGKSDRKYVVGKYFHLK